MSGEEETLRRAYEAFNARDIDAVLSLMDADVGLVTRMDIREP